MDPDQFNPFAPYGLHPHTCHYCRKLGIERAGLAQKSVWIASDVRDAAENGCAFMKLCLDSVKFSATTKEPLLEVHYPWLGHDGHGLQCFVSLVWTSKGSRLQHIALAAAAIPSSTRHGKLSGRMANQAL